MGLKGNVPFWRVREFAAPAAGVDHVFTARGDSTVLLVSATGILVTDANVANRAVRFEVTDGQTVFYRSGGSFTQAAGTTVRYSLISSGSDFGNVATVVHLPLPADGLVLLPGWRANLVTQNIQVGDQWGVVGSLVEVFPNGPDFEWVPTTGANLWERS